MSCPYRISLTRSTNLTLASRTAVLHIHTFGSYGAGDCAFGEGLPLTDLAGGEAMAVEPTVPFTAALPVWCDKFLRQLGIARGQSKASLVRRGVPMVLAEAGLLDAEAPDRVPATSPAGRIIFGRTVHAGGKRR